MEGVQGVHQPRESAQLAVAFIQASFTAAVTSLVNDIIMPAVGLALGELTSAACSQIMKAPGRTYNTVELAKEAGAVTHQLWHIYNAIIVFISWALVLFFPTKAYMTRSPLQPRLRSARTAPGLLAPPAA